MKRADLKIAFVAMVIAFGATLQNGLGSPTDLKVGVVNVQEILDSVEEGKKARAQMEGEILKKKKDLEDRQKEYKKLDDAYEKQKLVLAPQALGEKQKELETKKAELQKLYLASQGDIQKLELQLSGDIIKRIRSVIAKIGQEGGYDLVLEKNEGGLFYYKDTYDITKKVIEEYNRSYKK